MDNISVAARMVLNRHKRALRETRANNPDFMAGWQKISEKDSFSALQEASHTLLLLEGINPPSAKILQIASGPSLLLLHLKQQTGHRVFGLDKDVRATKLCGQFGINMLRADARGRKPFPLVDESLDVVISGHFFCLDYLIWGDPDAHFKAPAKEIFRILKPRGRFISVSEDILAFPENQFHFDTINIVNSKVYSYLSAVALKK